MQAVVDRLKKGDRRIVPLRGGYWVPGDIVKTLTPFSEYEWFNASFCEFGCHIGTQTIDALRRRNILISTEEPGNDTRPPQYALKIHVLNSEV